MIFGPQFIHALLISEIPPSNGSGELTGNFVFNATSTIDENISGPSNSNWFVTELSSNFYITSASAGYHGVSANGTTGWAQVGGSGSWNAQYSEPIVSFSNDSILWCTGFVLYSFDGTTTSAITTGKEAENCYSIYKDATYYYLRTGSGIYRSTSLTTGWTSVYSGGSASYEGGLRFNDNVTFIWDKGYLWTSTNGGASFTKAFGGLSGLDYNPTDDYWMKMQWVTDGRAAYSISQDDGTTWTDYIPIDQDGSGNQPIDRARELKYIGGDKWLMLSDDNDTSLKGLYSVTSPKLTYDGFYQGWTKEFSLTGAARKMSIENYDTLFITELGTVVGTNTQTKIHKFDLERAGGVPNVYTYIAGTVGTQPNLGSAGSVTGVDSSISFGYYAGSNYVSSTSYDYIIVNSPSFEEAKRIYDNGIITNGGTFQYNYIDITFLDELQVGTILYATGRVQDSNYNTFNADLAVDFLRLIDQGGGSYTGYNVGDGTSVQDRYILRYPNYGTDGNGNAWYIGIDSTTSAITDIIEESEFNSLATKEFYFTQNSATVADAANPTLEELNSIESLNLNTGYTSAQDVLTEKHLLWADPTATTNPLNTITNGNWYGFIKEEYFVNSYVPDINWNGWLKSSSTKTPNSSGSSLGKEVASIITNSNYIDRNTFSATNFFPVFTMRSSVYPVINISSNSTEAIDLENTLPRVGTTRYELGYAWSDDGNKIALATGDNSGSKVYWANVGDSSWTDIGIPAGRFFNTGIQSVITWEGNTVYICIRNKYIYSYDTVAATGWVEDNGSAAIASAGYSGFFTDLDWAAINRVKISDGTYIWAGIGYRNSSTLNVVYGSSLTAMQEDFVKSRAGAQTTNPVGVLSLNSNNGVYILENVGDMLYAHHNNSTINITIGNTAWSNSFGTYRHVVGKSDGSELMITANTSVYQYASDGVNFTQYTPNITNQAWYSGSEAWECVYDQINDIWFLVTRTYVSQEPGGKVIYTKTPSDVNSWKIAHLNRSSYVSNAFENAICKPRYTTPAPTEFGQTYTFLNGGSLSVYEDNYSDAESLSSAGDPYYFLNFGPGTSDLNADARALDYVKNTVAWLTNQSASNILLDTNYTITSSDFTRVTLGAHSTGESTNVIAWVEPASSGTSVSISRSFFGSRKYAIRFNGGWAANPGLNTGGTMGAGVAGVWWKKTLPTTTIISQNQTPGTVVDTDYWKLKGIIGGDSGEILIGDPYGDEFVLTTDDGWTATPSKITDLQGTGPYSSLGNRAFKLDTNSLQVGAFITDENGTFINSNNTHNTTYNRLYSDFSTPMYAAVKTSGRTEKIIDETLLVKVEQYNGYVRITELIDIS